MKKEASAEKKVPQKTSSEKNNIINNLNIEGRQTLMNAFAWLIQEDKKLNPSFYQIKNNHNSI